MRIESGEELRPGAPVSLRAERHGQAAVRNVAIDYYEVLQVSPNAEPETIDRVYRIMAGVSENARRCRPSS